jgi:hypothetical protein
MVISIFFCFNSIDIKKYMDKHIGWCLTFIGVYICAWINNNANILYLWFKTILKVCFITCIAVLPRP